MAALRCTAKLLKRLKTAPAPEPPAPQNRLGDWTANLLQLGRWQVVLAVNDLTRLGVAVEAAPIATMTERLAEAIAHSLLDLGIPDAVVNAELAATLPLAIAATNSRSVLGTLTQYAFEIEVTHAHQPPDSTLAINRRLLKQLVLSPRHIGRPADRVREAFGLPPMPRHRRGDAANDAVH
ncbi:MAG: DUF6933 domain-containing protein [Panacagrimonas sp.]